MNWFLCKSFQRLKEYAKVKKQNRALVRQACKFYLQTLFKKSFKAVKAQSLLPYKKYWFGHLKKYHLVMKRKEECLVKQHELYLVKDMFETWYLLQKEEENYTYLVHSMLKFYVLRLKAKAWKGFVNNRTNKINSRDHDKMIIFRRNKKFFKLLKQQANVNRAKKLKRGQAYEFYYLSLLKKAFYEWLPSCKKIRQEGFDLQLKEKYFYFWKKLFVENEDKKMRAVTVLRAQILKKVALNMWKDHHWFTKRIKIARKFHLYRKFVGWKLAVSRLQYKKQQKQKADVWFKWKAEKKYFEKFYVNYKKEKRLSKEYKIKVYQFQKRKERHLLEKYFKGLTCALMMKHVESVRSDKVLSKCFRKWTEMTYNQKLKRHKKKEFNRRMKLAKYFTVFNVLKDQWVTMKKKEYMAIQVFRYLKQRRAFKLWQTIMIYETNTRKLRARAYYERQFLQRYFNALNYNRIQKKKQRSFEEKLDWFLEKKIRRFLKKILRKLYIWAKANIKYKQHSASLLYHVFFNLKLNAKLQTLNTMSS